MTSEVPESATKTMGNDFQVNKSAHYLSNVQNKLPWKGTRKNACFQSALPGSVFYGNTNANKNSENLKLDKGVRTHIQENLGSFFHLKSTV